jgi:uncharacterized protein
VTPFSISGAGIRCSTFIARARWLLVASCLALAILVGPASPAGALSPSDFPKQAPASHVLDEAHVLSRASSQEIERVLQTFSDERVDAKVITVAKLDYGLSLNQLGQDLLAQWGSPQGDQEGEGPSRLLLLIDAQTRSTAVVASKGLTGRLPAELLESTAESTMAIPLRTADRYRQATLDALSRLSTVLSGGEDPGEPELEETPTVVSNIPSKEDTESSHAFTWVVVLLVIGTVVPMVTWWVFSR